MLYKQYGANFEYLCHVAQDARHRFWHRDEPTEIKDLRSTWPAETERHLRWEDTSEEYRQSLALELLFKLEPKNHNLDTAVSHDRYQRLHASKCGGSAILFGQLSPVEQFEAQLCHALVLGWAPAVYMEWNAMKQESGM